MGIVHGDDKCLHGIYATPKKSTLAIRPINLIFATIVIAILPGLGETHNHLATATKM